MSVTAKHSGLGQFDPVFLLNDPAGAPLAILCVVDGPGATWRISFEQPLQRLRDSGAVRLMAVTEESLANFIRTGNSEVFASLAARLKISTLIVSRCHRGTTLMLVLACRQLGIAVIYHIDDDLLNVPSTVSVSKHLFYSSPARQSPMRMMMRSSSVVYCSTRALAYRVQRLDGLPKVHHGEIYCSAESSPARYVPHESRTIGYMGTAGHGADIGLIVPAIATILTAYSDVIVEIFGTVAVPRALAIPFAGRVRQVPPVSDYDEFTDKLRSLKWAAALAPLSTSHFNSVKAETKFIEYTYAGMPVIASSGGVYDRLAAGGRGLLADGTAEWVSAMSSLLCDASRASEMVRSAQSFILRNYSRKRLEKQVMDVIGMATSLASKGA